MSVSESLNVSFINSLIISLIRFPPIFHLDLEKKNLEDANKNCFGNINILLDIQKHLKNLTENETKFQQNL